MQSGLPACLSCISSNGCDIPASLPTQCCNSQKRILWLLMYLIPSLLLIRFSTSFTFVVDKCSPVAVGKIRSFSPLLSVRSCLSKTCAFSGRCCVRFPSSDDFVCSSSTFLPFRRTKAQLERLLPVLQMIPADWIYKQALKTE